MQRCESGVVAALRASAEAALCAPLQTGPQLAAARELNAALQSFAASSPTFELAAVDGDGVGGGGNGHGDGGGGNGHGGKGGGGLLAGLSLARSEVLSLLTRSQRLALNRLLAPHALAIQPVQSAALAAVWRGDGAHAAGMAEAMLAFSATPQEYITQVVQHRSPPTSHPLPHLSPPAPQSSPTTHPCPQLGEHML